MEASQKFPKSTLCSTTHSIAYQGVVKAYNLRVGNFTYRDIKEVGITYDHKLEILELIREFCLSSHTTFDDFASGLEVTEFTTKLCNKYLSLMESGTIECTHDFYLKFFHLALRNQLVTYEPFDFIMLDEIGDVNEVTLEIFRLLPARIKVGTGDTCIPAHVRVLTSDGWSKMSSVYSKVQKGTPVSVKSYNHSTELFEVKPVTAAICNGAKPTLKIKTTNSTFECTSNHRVLTPNGYAEAGSLKVGDVVLKDGSPELKSIKRMPNHDQWHVILGSFLGDGNLDTCSNSKKELRLSLGHSVKQLSYLQWKAHAIGGTVTKTADAKVTSIKGKTFSSTEAYTATSKMFVLDRAITLASVRHLNPLSLAIWVMEDGSIRSKYQGEGKNFSITNDSNAFSLRENEFLVKVLKRTLA